MDKETKQEFKKVYNRFDKVDQRFAAIIKNMATKQDLADLREEMATKDDVNRILTVVDAYAKQSKDYFQEVKFMGARLDRIENKIL